MTNTLLGKILRWLERLFQADEPSGVPVQNETIPAGPRPTFHLQVRGEKQRIPITLKPGQQLVLGRARAGDNPEHLLDLAPYNALNLGVSSKHAAILMDGQMLTVMDMGSPNGTYVNGHRLMPHEPRSLQDGDDIRLGHLVLNLAEHKLRAFNQTVGVLLHSESAHDVRWWTYERSWNQVLDLASRYGWQPALGECRAYQPDIEVTQEDAQAFATALERALPDLAEEIPGEFFGPRLVHEHWQAGKLKIRDLIAFCRVGGFRIGPIMPEIENPRH